MRAFIVSSPYQILNSLQMCYPFDGGADIYVLNQFSDCSFLVDSLKRSGVFRNVVQVRNLTYVSRKPVQEFVDRNFFYSYKVSEFIKGRVYEQVYFAAMDLTVYMLMKDMKKRNPKLIIQKIEDGLGDYVSDSFKYTCVTDIRFHNIFGGDVFLGEAEAALILENIHLYAPQLVQNTKIRSNVKKVINNFIYTDFREKVNEIYHISHKDIPKTRVLVFDTSSSSGSYSKFDAQIADAINLLTYYFGKEEVGVKLHPRRKENAYIQNIRWGKGNIPAEIYFANMGSSLSEKIVVSVMATPSVTPKIIFDEEPYIISLHKILHDCDKVADEDFARYGNFLKQLEDLYREKKKIFVPEDREELENIVQYLMINKL